MGFDILHFLPGNGMTKRFLMLAGAAVLAACASGHKSAKPDAAMLASIPADLRMMGAESTWVAHGVGYELVTRSKLEILPLMTQLDDQSRFFVKMFGADPGKVIAAVRRIGPPGSMPEASAPVPFDMGPVVETAVIRPLQKGEKAPDPSTSQGGYSGRSGQGRGGTPRGGALQGDVNTDEPERFGASGPTSRVVRAWLSARAATLTKQPATSAAASATADDPRVPAWAEDAVPGLAVPTAREDTITARLATQIDSLFPIHSFLTMARPSTFSSLAGRGGASGTPGTTGRGGATGSSGGGYGGGGGMGGMGGMGGRRGGMGGMGGGRGGSGGGNNPRGSDGGRPNPPYSGGALFTAQSVVFGRYLTVREGPSFVGALIDAQIQQRKISDVFAAAQMVPSDLERLDIEFHRWLIDRATNGR